MANRVSSEHVFTISGYLVLRIPPQNSLLANAPLPSLLLMLMLFVVFFLTLETLKIVLPSRRELNFYKITFFTLDEKLHRKYIKKDTDFDANLGSETC